MPEVAPLAVGGTRGGVGVHWRDPSSPELFVKPSKLFPVPYDQMTRRELGARRGGLMTRARSYSRAIDKEWRETMGLSSRYKDLQRRLNLLQIRILEVDLYLHHGVKA